MIILNRTTKAQFEKITWLFVPIVQRLAVTNRGVFIRVTSINARAFYTLLLRVVLVNTYINAVHQNQKSKGKKCLINK